MRARTGRRLIAVGPAATGSLLRGAEAALARRATRLRSARHPSSFDAPPVLVRRPIAGNFLSKATNSHANDSMIAKTFFLM
jgi:hypothetical protein